jgi:hypothetical protein
MPKSGNPKIWTKRFGEDLDTIKADLLNGFDARTPSKAGAKAPVQIKEEILDQEGFFKTRNTPVKPTGTGATKDEPIVLDESPVRGKQHKPIVVDGPSKGGKQAQKKAKVVHEAPTFEDMKAKIDQDYKPESGRREETFSGGAQQSAGADSRYYHTQPRYGYGTHGRRPYSVAGRSPGRDDRYERTWDNPYGPPLRSSSRERRHESRGMDHRRSNDGRGQFEAGAQTKRREHRGED